MKDVLIYGSYNHQNLGDDLIMFLVDQLLRNNNICPYYFKSSNIDNCFSNDYCYVDNPFFVIDKTKNRVERYFEKIRWEEIKKFDAIIFIGGGYTAEIFGLRNLFKIYLLCKLGKKNKKKVIFTGQTIGPSTSVIGKILLKKIYKLASFVSVREIYSKKYLEKNKISGDLIGDDAYLAFPMVKSVVDEDYIVFNSKMFDNYVMYEDAYFNFLLLIAKKFKCKIKVASFRINEKSNEYIENLKLNQFLVDNNIDSEFIFLNSVDKVIDLFKNCKAVVGTAYHCIEMGLMCGKMVYAGYCGDYYLRKMKGLLSLYNIDNMCCFDISKLEKNEDKCSDVFQNIFLTENINLNSVSEEIYNNVINEWNNIINYIENGGDI